MITWSYIKRVSKELWQSLVKELQDDYTNYGLGYVVLLVFVSILWTPLFLTYLFVRYILFNALMFLVDIPRIGLRTSFLKHFKSDIYEKEQDARKKERDAWIGKMFLPSEHKKTFVGKELWPKATVVDDVALYGADGRTLLYVQEGVQEFDVPEGVINIYHRCFELCTSLQRVSLPSTLRRIGNRAFCCCVSLKEIVIPQSVTSLGEEAFRDCTSLEKIILPNNSIEIPERMFENCRKLRSISLPSETLMICKFAFRHCVGLEHVIMNDKLEIVREKAFQECFQLREFICPETVRFIEVGAFNDCHSLEHIHMSGRFEAFGGSLCENCWNLQKITMSPNEKYKKDIEYDWSHNSKKVKPSDSENPYPQNKYWSDGKALYSGVPRFSTVKLVLCLSKDDVFEVPSFVTSIKKCAFTTCKHLRKLRLSPKLIDLASDNDSLITEETIYNYWPQIDEIEFTDELNFTPYDVRYL